MESGNLKKTLGDFYYSVAKEKLVLTIDFPIVRGKELISLEKAVNAIEEAFEKNLNVSKKEVKKIIQKEITVTELVEEKLEPTLFNKVLEAK